MTSVKAWRFPGLLAALVVAGLCRGSACANTVSQYAMSGVLLGYIIWRKLHLVTWGGIISVVELGAQAIMMQLATVACVFFCFIGFCALLSTTMMTALKNVIAYIFTNDREIATLVSRLMSLFVLFNLFGAIANTCGGILQGSGKQKIGAITNAIGYYLVGLPIGISLMLAVKLGVFGLWCGFMFPVVIQTIVYIVYILRMDWDKACQEAQVRSGGKLHKNHIELIISKLETSSTGFGMVDGYPVVDQGITGAVILPDAVYHENHSEHLVLQEESSSELSKVVGEVLSLKQLLLRRGLALCLAVLVLLTGLIIKILTGK